MNEPAPEVPVALLARTSTLVLQDPLASLRRQIRACAGWLPAGWVIAGYYWDVESGGIDLEDRSQGDDWKPFAAAGIPRDGGMAELLAEAQTPAPRFAAVVCEDIERSGRDTFNALKLEKLLGAQGIPLFATDEPASIEGANATTVLIRRVKQGVAEWTKIAIKEKAWKGLQEHSLAGWNIGPAAYGYVLDRVPHEVPAKAAQGRTRSKLAVDEVRGPVITQIFDWRVNHHLAVPTITWMLNADPAAYPPPGDAPGWAETSVAAILRNPKYTGYMVFGRTRTPKGQKKARPVPPAQWLWSPEPTHPALTSRDTWHAAQAAGADHGNVRDAAKPAARPGRSYVLRSRVRCNGCQHRMRGVARPTTAKANPGAEYIYYLCPYRSASPRHHAAWPAHPATSVSVREDTLLAAIGGFLDQYVFGHGRAAHLAAAHPAPGTGPGTRRARITALRTELARIETAQNGLMTELEELGADTSPAASAYRARIRARNADWHDKRETAETQLAELENTPVPDTDPTLLDELPYLTRHLADAPPELLAQLIDALDIQCLYRKDKNQVTIWATITPATPATITALLTDPRTDPAPAQPVSSLEQGHISPKSTHDHEAASQARLHTPPEYGVKLGHIPRHTPGHIRRELQNLVPRLSGRRREVPVGRRIKVVSISQPKSAR